MNDIMDSVAAVARRHLPAESVDELADPDADLMALGLASVMMVAFMLDLERTFSLSFHDELIDVSVFRSVRSVAEAISSMRAADDG